VNCLLKRSSAARLHARGREAGPLACRMDEHWLGALVQGCLEAGVEQFVDASTDDAAEQSGALEASCVYDSVSRSEEDDAHDDAEVADDVSDKFAEEKGETKFQEQEEEAADQDEEEEEEEAGEQEEDAGEEDDPEHQVAAEPSGREVEAACGWPERSLFPMEDDAAQEAWGLASEPLVSVDATIDEAASRTWCCPQPPKQLLSAMVGAYAPAPPMRGTGRRARPRQRPRQLCPVGMPQLEESSQPAELATTTAATLRPQPPPGRPGPQRRRPGDGAGTTSERSFGSRAPPWASTAPELAMGSGGASSHSRTHSHERVLKPSLHAYKEQPFLPAPGLLAPPMKRRWRPAEAEGREGAPTLEERLIEELRWPPRPPKQQQWSTDVVLPALFGDAGLQKGRRSAAGGAAALRFEHASDGPHGRSRHSGAVALG